jgi:hypothetical protein
MEGHHYSFAPLLEISQGGKGSCVTRLEHTTASNVKTECIQHPSLLEVQQVLS